MRRWTAAGLVVLTTLLVVASSVAVWAHRTVFDTDRFMSTVEPALNDPALYDALADTVTTQTLEVLDLDTRVSTRLSQLDEIAAAAVVGWIEEGDRPLLEGLLGRVDRPSLAALTPVVVERLEGRVERVVDRLVHSDAFRDRLPQLVARAHEAAIGIARADLDDYPNVYLTDDAVMLNTLPLVGEAAREVLGEFGDLFPGVTLPDVVSDHVDEARDQLADALGERIPEDAGQVRIMDAATFDLVQDTARQASWSVVLLIVVTVLAIAATLVTAPNRRRATIQLGLAVVAGLVIAAAAIARLRDLVVDVALQPDGRHVAGVLFDTVSNGLHEIFWLIGIVAGVTAVVAVLLGRPAWIRRAAGRWPWVATATGRDGTLFRWVSDHADLLRVAVGVAAVLVLVITGFRWVAVVLVVLGGAAALWGIEAARRTARLPGKDRAPDGQR
jgi:uncharacterized protein with HEPN domain